MQVTLPHNFAPRPYQSRAMRYLDAGGKRAITVWHRRAGKDLSVLHQTAKSAHLERGAYWHFFPTFEQARRSIWEGYTKSGERILEQAFPGFLDPSRPGSIVARKNDQQMFLEFKCGSLWRLMGTDRTESVGAGPKGVAFSEFALCRPTAWDFVRPMLRESGGWAWFITTPRGRNHAKRLYDAATADSGWYRDLQTVRDTGLTYASNRGAGELDAEAMMAEERAEGMAEELIRQEYLCDWSAALVGAVWGALLEQMAERTELDFAHEVDGVHVTMDLGISDSTSAWFWRPRGEGVEFIDHLEASGKPLSYYADEIRARKYKLARIWLPHDARARTLVTGSSVLEEMTRLLKDLAPVSITPQLSLYDGLQAGRWLLQRDETRFHSRCAQGVEALRHYHYEYDEDAKTFGRKPAHDWSSHSADGFRYAAVVRRIALSMMPETPPERVVVKPAGPHLAVPLDELWRSNPARGGGRV